MLSPITQAAAALADRSESTTLLLAKVSYDLTPRLAPMAETGGGRRTPAAGRSVGQIFPDSESLRSPGLLVLILYHDDLEEADGHVNQAGVDIRMSAGA